jgi:hypothetical protein
MKKSAFAIGVIALAAVMATTTFAANRGIEFRPLGFLPDLPPEIIRYSWGTSISADGTVVSGSPSPYGACMLWNEGYGWTLIGDANTSSCYLSEDGTTVASRLANDMGYEVSALWTAETGWEILEGQEGNARCDYLLNGSFGISGDGSTVGGLTWEGCGYARGYNWTREGGMVVMEGLLDDDARVNGLNYDGSVSVGWTRIPWGGWQATRWVDGMPEWIQDPGPDYNDFLGAAEWTNSDGSIVSGSGYQEMPSETNPFGSPTGWVWNEMTGELQGTGAMPWAWFTDQGYAFAASEDGNIVVGRFGFGPFSVATMWTPWTGLVDLNQFLINQGSTAIFDGWTLTQINDITPDGTRLLGCGANPDGFFGCNEAFLIDISKVSVCHAPGGDVSKARTLNVSLESLGDHVGHGDFLGTCEAAAGGFARSTDPHQFIGMTEEQARSYVRAADSFTPNHSEMMAPVANPNYRGAHFLRRGEMTPAADTPEATTRAPKQQKERGARVR